MKSSQEIREYFFKLINNALPRLSMFGGETAARFFLSHLAFIDERDLELENYLNKLTERGAFTSLGVSGAFRKYTHLQATDVEIASVYAEIAFKMGYLNTDRILIKSEFESLHSGLRKTCRSQDLNTEDVVQQFGTPSWKAGTNPSWPWVFLYFCNELDHGSIAFDFWNDGYYDLPVLRNIRIQGPNFGREFTFTPLGRKITKRD